MVIVARLVSRFNAYYNERPSTLPNPSSPISQPLSTRPENPTNTPATTVLTMMVTNAVLSGIADTVAQSITAIRERAVRKGIDPKDDRIAIEIHELDRKNPMSDRDLIPDSRALPPPFDFERLTRFMAYGFAMAPVQFKWFKFLERCFPMTKGNNMVPSLKRVAFDQLIFSPFGTYSDPGIVVQPWIRS